MYIFLKIERALSRLNPVILLSIESLTLHCNVWYVNKIISRMFVTSAVPLKKVLFQAFRLHVLAKIPSVDYVCSIEAQRMHTRMTCILLSNFPLRKQNRKKEKNTFKHETVYQNHEKEISRQNKHTRAYLLSTIFSSFEKVLFSPIQGDRSTKKNTYHSFVVLYGISG